MVCFGIICPTHIVPYTLVHEKQKLKEKLGEKTKKMSDNDL